MFSEYKDYYLRWYHSRPVAITTPRREELRRLHKVMYKCIEYMVGHYEDWVPKYMPLSPREMDILKEQSRYRFKAGTYRPDYILSEDGQLMICEISSRFFAHGIFMSWFGEQDIARMLEDFPEKEYHSQFWDMMDYMLEIVGGKKQIFVFKSADKTAEIKLYKKFYEDHGISCEVIEVGQIEDRMQDWVHDAFLVSAMNQNDILSLSDKTLEAMMAGGLCSDLRNIFLIHDKRFMALWFDDNFTSQCLDEEETVFLRQHAIPTFLTLPEDALDNKDKYIIKPQRLGKSEGIMPGFRTKEEEWRRRLANNGEGMITQPFIKQKTFHTVWEGTPFEDYLCGMMTCVDDKYFESGYYRCSSFPLTNMFDDRKASPLYTDDKELLERCDIL